jgi:hypothetical protein
VRGKKDMEIGIVRFQRQLHQQQRKMHGDCRQQNQAHGNGPGCRGERIIFLHNCLAKKNNGLNQSFWVLVAGNGKCRRPTTATERIAMDCCTCLYVSILKSTTTVASLWVFKAPESNENSLNLQNGRAGGTENQSGTGVCNGCSETFPL